MTKTYEARISNGGNEIEASFLAEDTDDVVRKVRAFCDLHGYHGNVDITLPKFCGSVVVESEPVWETHIDNPKYAGLTKVTLPFEL